MKFKCVKCGVENDQAPLGQELVNEGGRLRTAGLVQCGSCNEPQLVPVQGAK